MFKLLVLSVLVAVAVARPGLLHHEPLIYSAPALTYHEPALVKVGTVVKSIPTAVSHQSQTIVHSSAHIVEPIVAPVLKTYHAPVVVKHIAEPIVHTYSAPIVLPHGHHHGW